MTSKAFILLTNILQCLHLHLCPLRAGPPQLIQCFQPKVKNVRVRWKVGREVFGRKRRRRRTQTPGRGQIRQVLFGPDNWSARHLQGNDTLVLTLCWCPC